MDDAAIRPGAKITGVFQTENGQCMEARFVDVSTLCSCCNCEPATHLVAMKYHEGYMASMSVLYNPVCLACVIHGMTEGWYPYGVKIRKRK